MAAWPLVWEIDHPDTQAWKSAALRRAGMAEPANVRFVSADLSAVAIGDLGIPARATWNWLGVTMYLKPEATAAALRAIAAGRAGTTLVVNFLLADGTLDALGHSVRDCSAATVAATGEPVVATYTRDEAQSCWARRDLAASSCSTPVGCGTLSAGPA